MKDQLYYCCQCADKTSGKVGSFIHRGDFVAISGVFPDLYPFYQWINTSDEYALDHEREPWGIKLKKK